MSRVLLGFFCSVRTRWLNPYAVSRLKKPSSAGVSTSSVRIRSTRASIGPFLAFSSIVSTLSAGPLKTASTVPSEQFLTQPFNPSAVAFSAVQARNQTPWTRPWKMAWMDFVGLFKGHNHLIDGKAVTGLGFDLFDRCVLGGAQHVFHFHGFNHGQLFTRFDLLARFHRHRQQQPRHG